MSEARSGAAVMEELIAARDLVDALVNGMAPSSNEEVEAVRALRRQSDALTAVINGEFVKPIGGLGRAVVAPVAELQKARARLRQAESNLEGVKVAIDITDTILQIGVAAASALL